jgi:Arc/MetJ-type ribon-helix-helix transcriptional regulator
MLVERRTPVDSGGMVIGMATKKLTITLEQDQLERVRDLVADGAAPSISGFVQHAVGVALDDVAGWGAMLAAALVETGGELSSQELRWADEVLGTKKPGKTSAA